MHLSRHNTISEIFFRYRFTERMKEFIPVITKNIEQASKSDLQVYQIFVLILIFINFTYITIIIPYSCKLTLKLAYRISWKIFVINPRSLAVCACAR